MACRTREAALNVSIIVSGLCHGFIFKGDTSFAVIATNCEGEEGRGGKRAGGREGERRDGKWV